MTGSEMKNIVSAIQRGAFAFGILLLFPGLAQAHVGVGDTSGFSHGFCHPLGGLDHLCAMIAVGLWAAQTGGRSLWAIPLTFVAVMAFGAVLGMAGAQVPFVERGIVVSVLALGVLIAASARLPLAPSIILVGLFAVFHGYAHGAEMPTTAPGFGYGIGFILATALLHLCGIGIGIGIQRLASAAFVRFAGAVIALCGAYLWFS